MTLACLQEWETPRMLVRLAACDCEVGEQNPDGLCGTRLLFASVPGAHEELWLASAMGPAHEVPQTLAYILDGGEMPAVVEAGLALVGLPWEVVAGSRSAALLQMGAFERLPEWMYRLPRGLLWMTRGCTFGGDLTRTPRALWALHRAYVPEGPYRMAEYLQTEVWAFQPSEGPALEPWS
jgi:hypothetical protein